MICGHGSYNIQTVSLIYSDKDFGDPGISLFFSLIIHCPLCCTVAGQLSLMCSKHGCLNIYVIIMTDFWYPGRTYILALKIPKKKKSDILK